MEPNTSTKRSPSVEATKAEVQRVEEMIATISAAIDSTDCTLKTSMHLQVYRAELRAYWAGLLYSLGYTDLFDNHFVRSEVSLPESGEDEYLLDSEIEETQFIN